MQVVWNREASEDSVEKACPGGLAGWVLGMVRGRQGRRTQKHLRVVEHLSLGGRRQLTLVVCDGERFLVGGGADGVESIVRVGQRPAAEDPCV